MVDRYSCSHEESNWIPCEDFLNGQGEPCGKNEENYTQSHDDQKCKKCREQDREDEADVKFQHDLQRIAEDESLAPVPKSTARDPNAPKRFFKRCIKWESCGREF